MRTQSETLYFYIQAKSLAAIGTMHLYIITRGIKKEVDDFITQLQGKYLPFKFRQKKEDPMQDATVQLAVRPIQLWELAYPKECNDLVCATVLGTDYKLSGNDGKKTVKHKFIDKFMWGLRKLLGADPIPKYKTDKVMPISRQHMTVLGIGTKQDYIMDNGVEGL